MIGDDRASAPYQVSHLAWMSLSAATDNVHAFRMAMVSGEPPDFHITTRPYGACPAGWDYRATGNGTYPAHVSTEHPNTTAYRATAAAFRAGELDTLATLIAEDVVWHVPGTHARDIVGIDALLTFLRVLAARGFRLEEHDVFGNDDHVCALSVMSVRQDDVEVSTRVVSVFHYRDGKQLERWFYPDDPAAWESVFAEGT